MKTCKTLALVLAFCMLFSATAHAAETPVLRAHKTGGQKIALTFDDGPHPHYTAEILDLLAKWEVHATFFVIGKNAEAHPELVRRMAAEGHEIGNHTYSHPRLRGIGFEELAAEISKNRTLLAALTGTAPTLFRPPEGVTNPNVLAIAEAAPCRVVLWSIDTRDWALRPAGEIVRSVLHDVKDGDIILFHDYVVGKSPTPTALRLLLPRLVEMGYSFVTVSELTADN